MTYGTERITRTLRPATGGAAGQVIEDVTVAKSVVNVWIRLLLQEAEAHHLKVAATVASLNIEQRRVALAQEQGAMWFEALNRILTRLGIMPDDPRLITIVPEVIAELAG